MQLKHATVEQLLKAWQGRFDAAGPVERARLSRWLMDRLDALDVTDVEARGAFGMGVSAYSALKGQINRLRASYNAILADAR